MKKQEYIDSILNTEINGKNIRSMSAKEFCLFCLSKLSNVSAFDKRIVDLTKQIQSYNTEIITTLSDEIKLDILEQLKQLELL